MILYNILWQKATAKKQFFKKKERKLMTRNLPSAKFGNVERRTFSRIKGSQEIPNLVEVQKDSYKAFIDEGIAEVFEDFSPITDFSDRFELYFLDHKLLANNST